MFEGMPLAREVGAGGGSVASPAPATEADAPGSSGPRSASPGGKRLAADMRHIASILRKPQGHDGGSPIPSALGLSVATSETTMEAVSIVQRQRDAERRLFDRRLSQLEQRLARVEGSQLERMQETDWRKKFAEVHGSVSGLQEEVQGLERRIGDVEETVQTRLGGLELLKQRVHEAEQQVQSMELKVRHSDSSVKEVERSVSKLRSMEQNVDDIVRRLLQVEEEVLVRGTHANREIVEYGARHPASQDMVQLQQRIESLEELREVPQFRGTALELSQAHTSICDLAEQVSHLAQRAAGFEAAQLSLQHKVGDVLGRVSAVEGGLALPSRHHNVDVGAMVDGASASDVDIRAEVTAAENDSDLRGQVNELTNFVLELSEKPDAIDRFEALSDVVARQEEAVELYISYIKCIASDHSEQVNSLRSRLSDMEKHFALPLQDSEHQVDELVPPAFLTSVNAQLVEVQEELIEVRGQLAEALRGSRSSPQQLESMENSQEMTDLQQRVLWLEERVCGSSVDQALQAMPSIVQAASDIAQAQSTICDVVEQVNHLSLRSREYEEAQHALQHTVGEVAGQMNSLQGLAEVQALVQTLSERLSDVQVRVDAVVPGSSKLQETASAVCSKFQLGADFLNTMQDRDPIEIDLALEHLQVTCLQAADDIAAAVRLELQDMPGALLSEGSMQDPSVKSLWHLAAEEDDQLPQVRAGLQVTELGLADLDEMPEEVDL